MNEFIDEKRSVNNEEEMRLSSVGIGYLLETAKWARFLSIVGFVFVGLMVLGGLVMSVTMMALVGPAMLVGFLYVVMAVIYYFPILYLYKFSNDLKEAINRRDNEQLERALGSLQSHYKFLGVFTIVILSIYALMLLFSGIMTGLM